MLDRRKFLALTAAAAPALALGAGRRVPLGVQLYTVRSLITDSNLFSILRRIRAIGYDQVEYFGGMYGHSARQLASITRRAGLTAPSGHFDYKDFVSRIPYASQLGLKWMVCPMLPQAQWSSPEGYRKAAATFNQWGRLCQRHGMSFAYHNHNYEFQDLKGTTGFDILLKETDPDLVSLELDVYWITQAGRDPVLLLRQLGDRVRLLHLKDRKPDAPTSQTLDESAAHFTEVGNGTIRWKELLALAQRQGVEGYFVEQDQTDGDPIQSLTSSYKFLRNVLA